MNGVPMAELMGLVRELVGEMKGFQEELREVKEAVEKGFKNVARASHSWHRISRRRCARLRGVVGGVPTGGDGPGEIGRAHV